MHNLRNLLRLAQIKLSEQEPYLQSALQLALTHDYDSRGIEAIRKALAYNQDGWLQLDKAAALTHLATDPVQP